MNRKTFLSMLEEIQTESNRIKKLKKKIAKTDKVEKRDEILGELSAVVFQLKTHCNLMDEKLKEVSGWKSLAK